MFKVKTMSKSEALEYDWKTPKNGIVTMYHSTNFEDFTSFVENGIVAHDYKVWMLQYPVKFDTHKYTIEFEVNVNDLYDFSGIRNCQEIVYERIDMNVYTTCITYYGAWYSVNDIKPSQITQIVENETGRVVYRRVQ